MGIGITVLLVVAGIGMVGVVILFFVVRAAVDNGNRNSHDSK